MSDGSLTDGGGHVPIAVTTRSGVDESVHHGSVVALDEHGHELFVAGDPSRPMYPRSALKPLQAEAMLRCGLDVGDQQLALVCASHDLPFLSVKDISNNELLRLTSGDDFDIETAGQLGKRAAVVVRELLNEVTRDA